MNPSATIVELKHFFPAGDQSWLFAALRQEPLVWSALENNTFRRACREALGPNPREWTPAALALIALESSLSGQDPRQDPSADLPADLRQQAFLALEGRRRAGGKPFASLAEAGLTALALREQYRQRGGWAAVFDGLGAAAPWAAALACLPGLLADPLTPIQVLAAYPALLPAAAHALLSQPNPPEAQAELALEIIQELAPLDGLRLVQSLEASQPAMATAVAAGMLTQSQAEQPAGVSLLYAALPAAPRPSDGLHALWAAAAALQTAIVLAELHRMAAQAENAEKCYEAARQQAAWLAAQAHDQRWLAAAASGGLAQIFQPDSPAPAASLSPGGLARLCLALTEKGRSDEAARLLEGAGDHPAILAARALLADENGQTESACTQAMDALAGFQAADPALEDAPLLGKLAEIFLHLECPAEAAQAAGLALALQPNDPAWLAIQAAALRSAGRFEEALAAAHLAAGLAPCQAACRRELAACLETLGDWAGGLAEREAVLALVAQAAGEADPNAGLPEQADLHALAHSALRSGALGRARQACESALQIDPEDGLAHAILGQACAALEDEPAALEHYQQATRFAPHQPLPWLVLAEAQQKGGDSLQALETLRLAAQAAPDSAEVHLALGKACLYSGSPAQALPALRRAAELVNLPYPPLKHNTGALARRQATGSLHLPPIAQEVALRLGQALHQLGRYAEARPALALAHKANPGAVEPAQAYARTLVAAGEPREALSALAVVVKSAPTDATPYLDYARVVLQVGEQPEAAIQALRQALNLSPANPEALALMAECLAARGAYPEAMSYYRAALDTPLVKDPRWMARLALGLGHVAIRQGSHEIAVAVLQEAAQAAPRHLALHQTLSEACLAARLHDDALAAARHACELAPADLPNLLWFCEQALRLGAEVEAVQALERAAQLIPQEPAWMLRLGGIQLKAGQQAAARATYRAITNLPEVSLEDLHQAAHGLLRVQDAPGAIVCLERVRQAPLPEQAQIAQEILLDLAEAYQQIGDQSKALQILEEALAEAPKASPVLKQKARLHQQLDAPLAALACLQQVIAVDPHDTQALEQITEIYAEAGNLPQALVHAQQRLQACAVTPDHPEELSARLQAARLASALLQTDLQHALLAEHPTMDDLHHEPGLVAAYYQMAVDQALETGEEISAADLLNRAMQIQPDTSGLLALQSRLLIRRGDEPAARQKLSEAAQAVEAQGYPQAEARLAALAALDLGDFRQATSLLEACLAPGGQERPVKIPLYYLALAQALTLQAEAQRFGEAVLAERRLPGSAALNQAAHQSFEKAIHGAIQSLTPPDSQAGNTRPQSLPPALLRWQYRGQAVFAPDTPEGHKKLAGALIELSRLAPNAEDTAAYMAALLRTGNRSLAVQVGRDYPHHPAVLAQACLAQIEHEPTYALGAALGAVEKLPPHLPSRQAPLYHALLALAAVQVKEHAQAYAAIETALRQWPDEPRWQALAANQCRALENIPGAILHLEKAANLSPTQAAYRLDLGELYVQGGRHAQAVSAFEIAASLDVRDPQPWLRLAQLHRQKRDFSQAAQYAEGYIERSPDSIEALLLRALIALEANDPRAAHSRIQAALRLSPEHPQALYLLGRCLAALNRTAESIQVLEKALPKAADPLPILLERIRLVRNLQGSQAALKELEALAHQYPQRVAVLGPLAEALSESGQNEAALQIAQQALQSDTSAIDQDGVSRLHSLTGRLLRRAGQLDQAIHHLTQAVMAAPDRLEPYLELGRVHQERRQYSQALQIYQQAIRVSPEDPRPYHQAGLALKENKDYLGAEHMVRRAAELAPFDLSVQRLLGSLVALNLVQSAQ
jgi:FimV-like protein